MFSLRGVARVLSEVCRVSEVVVWECVRGLSERVSISSCKILRRFVVFDETCVKIGGLECWVYVVSD